MYVQYCSCKRSPLIPTISVSGSLKEEIQQHVPTPVTVFNLALLLAVELTSSNQITSQQPIQSRSNPQRLNSNASFSFWPTKKPFQCHPLGICRFLVFKDSKGKTEVHKPGYPSLSQSSNSLGQCPLRLANFTVDSYVGKLRSILSDVRRQGDWNRTLLLVDPTTDPLVLQ